jgi:VCBS repeat-containing protein
METSGHAQTLVVLDDSYGVPFGQSLDVEAFGVLENDTLDNEPAGENGVTAELVNDVSHGMLVLNTDGSFSYTPDSSFNGSDTFIYQAVIDSVIMEATLILTACEGGPQLFTCWKESAYLDKVGELGYVTFQEGFEDAATWILFESRIRR